MKDGSMKRHAYSLIEMLVVLIIVGVLIAVTVPAIQRSRESARQTQCTNHQAELAKAVQMHTVADARGSFPGFRYQATDGASPVIGWAAQLFEYLGRSDLDPAQATYIETLVCPSDSGPTNTARLNYVANGGQAGSDSPADGVFFDHAKPLAERVYISKDDFHDGLRNTILLAENLDATEWNVTDEENQCILWPLTAGNEVNAGTGARPSSHHPGGFVAAFADGSVKFMAETEINADPTIYVALLTPGGNDFVPIATGDDDDDDDVTSTPGCGSLNVQKVVIQQPWYKFHIAEVELLERGSGANVAAGASATLTRKGPSHRPFGPHSEASPEAVDGDTNTTSVFSWPAPELPDHELTTLEIDLGGSYDIETIRVTNHNSNGGLLGGSGVYLYDASGERVWSNVVWDAADSSVHEFTVCNPDSGGSDCGLTGVYQGGAATRVDSSMALPYGGGLAANGAGSNMYNVTPDPPSPLTSTQGLGPVVWTGQIKADYTENYTFYVLVDNNIQLYIDGTLTVIDQNAGGWGNQPGRVSYLNRGIASVSLTAGEWRDIEIHFHDGGEGHMWLQWSSDSTPRSNIPSCNMQPY